MNIVMMKNFLMDFFRFVKKFPSVDDNWSEIMHYANLINEKYNKHPLVQKLLLAYEDYLEEREKNV